MGRRKRLRTTSTVDDQSHQQHSQGEDQTVDQEFPHQNFEGEDQTVDQQISQEQEVIQKKGRGHTAKSATWKMKSDTKIIVTFNKFGKPIGDEGNELTQFLGTLVRMADHVGIHYEEWRKVPMHKKEDMYSIVKSKFVIRPNETELIKKWIFYNMGKKWRHWKGLLKERAYDPSLTVDEIVAQQVAKDSRVNPEQFKKLVERWFSSDYQRTCDIKRMSRLKMQEPHVTGTKSFARLAEEEAIKNDGVYPSRGEIFRIAHTRKDGSIVNENVATILSSLKDVSSDSSNTQGTESDYTNDDYSKVKGPEKRGYIRCVGRMPTVKESSASSSTESQTVQQLKDGLARTQNALGVLFNLVKDHIPNANLSGVLNSLNFEVPDNLSVVPNNPPLGNRRSSSESHHNNGTSS